MIRASFSRVGTVLVIASVFTFGGALAQSPALYPARQYPHNVAGGAMAIRDVNGDNRPDAIVVSGNTLRVLPGDGKGGFEAPLTYPTGGQTAFGLDFGDFDGDGVADLAVGNFGSKDVTVLKGAQTAFPLFKTAPFGVQVVAVSAVDLDNDGDLDLAATKGFSTPPEPTDFFVTLQSGLTFEPPSAVTMLGGLRTVAFLDMDSDGVKDVVGGLVVNSGLPALCWARGLGNGAFGTAVPVRRSQGLGTSNLTTADLNFDGRPDLLVAGSSSKTLTSGLNLGDGSLALQSTANPNDGNIGTGLAVADLDNNGTLDVVTADGLVFAGNHSAGFGPPIRYEVGDYGISVGTGDLDGDGNIDAAFRIGSTQCIEVLLGTGGGRFVASRRLVPPFATFDFAIGRVNNDGLTDVVVGWQGILQVFLATAPGVYSSLPGAPVESLHGIGLDDVNNDGNLDAILARSTPANKLVEVRLGNGLGDLTTSTFLNLPGGIAPSTARAGVADLNADGKPDVVATTNMTGLTRFLGNADGTFGPDLTTPIALGLVSFVTGDWNQDGSVDVAAVSPTTQKLYLAYGDGAGGFPQLAQLNTFVNPQSIAAADINLDGYHDLAVGHSLGGSGVMLLTGGAAGGSFGGGNLYNAYDPVTSVDLGDADGDGDMDIVAATFNPGSGVVLFLGQTPGPFSAGVRFGSGYSDPTGIVKFADTNLDGRLDIVHSSLAEGTFILTNRMGLPAGVSTFGTGTFGCQGIHGTSANGAPKLGSQDFAVLATNAPPFGDGWLLVGDVPDPVGNDLLNFGAVLYIDPLASSFCQVVQIGADTKGLGRGVFPLPASPGLAGTHLFLQTLWAWPNCPILPLGFSSSRALDVILQAP